VGGRASFEDYCRVWGERRIETEAQHLVEMHMARTSTISVYKIGKLHTTTLIELQ